MSQSDTYQVEAGVTSAYRILLGDPIVNGLIDALGSATTKKFLKLHARYDALVKTNPKADPMQAMSPSEMPDLDNVVSYIQFLEKLENKLSIMRLPVGKELHSIVKQMIQVAAPALKQKSVASIDAATPIAYTPRTTNQLVKRPLASKLAEIEDAGKPVWNNKMFHGKLPQVPVAYINPNDLPYSYPSVAATLVEVENFAWSKHYNTRIEAELTNVTKRCVANILQHEAHAKFETKSIPELVAEAQEFLMDRNWIRYNLSNVAKASANLAKHGLQHEVTVAGMIQHIQNSRTLAYGFLGTNLELVLRKGVFALSRDLVRNTSFAGQQASLDVIVMASSIYVQCLARDWLTNMQEHLK